jgi:hypothetical protein
MTERWGGGRVSVTVSVIGNCVKNLTYDKKKEEEEERRWVVVGLTP